MLKTKYLITIKIFIFKYLIFNKVIKLFFKHQILNACSCAIQYMNNYKEKTLLTLN